MHAVILIVLSVDGPLLDLGQEGLLALKGRIEVPVWTEPGFPISLRVLMAFLSILSRNLSKGRVGPGLHFIKFYFSKRKRESTENIKHQKYCLDCSIS